MNESINERWSFNTGTMQYKHILISAMILFALCSCEKNKDNNVQPLDLVGTSWIAEAGKVMSGTEVLYYCYVEAVMLKDGKIATEDWMSEKRLYLSGVTDLYESGCMWYRNYNQTTYVYSYPTVLVFDQSKLYGSASIAADNKTATLSLTDATLPLTTFYKLDAKKDIDNDPWATTKWEGGKYICTMVFGNYNQLAHVYLYQTEGYRTSWRYEYRQIGGENVPYVDATYTTNQVYYQGETYDSMKCDYQGHVENIPDQGNKFVYTVHIYVKNQQSAGWVDKGVYSDTLNQYIHN